MARSIKFGGADAALVGTEIKVGQQAPDFTVVGNDLSETKLSAVSGIRLLVAVPSLDTGVCDAEVRRFNQEAANLPGVNIMVISMDLPFAQKRWCGAAGIEAVKTYSDHKYAAFGEGYGILIGDKRLLARAVFVVDSTGKVTYAEVVPAVADHPNYALALAAVREAK